MTTASRSRFLISESALKLSLTPPPSATGTDSLSCTSSASSHSSASFAIRRKQFRPTSVPNDQNRPHEARVHSESSSSLVSLGIVLVVSGAQPDSCAPRSLKRPHRLIEREPKEKNPDGQTKEQPRYKPPPPDVPLTVRRQQRPLKFTRTLPLYHPSRPLPPLPSPAESEPSVPPESQNPATRSSGRTRRPPPRNLEHLIVAVSNTAKQRQGSPAKKRKVVVIAADEMDVDVDAESETGSTKKKSKDAGSTSMEIDEPMVEETDSSSGRARRAARRSGGKESVTPTPPPQEPPAPSAPKTQASRASSGAQSKKPASSNGRSNARRVTRRNSDETSSEEKDTVESTPAPTFAPTAPRRTSARRSGGVEHAEGIAVSVRA